MKQPDWIARASETVRLSNPHIFDTNRKKTSSRPIAGSRNGKYRGMNKTEAQFAERLELEKRLGKIRDYLFHPFRMPWAGMHYTPDFMVIPNSGLEKRRMIEVKGPHIHYAQQAIARFKGCRSYWPEFAFEMWQRTKAGWKQKY